MIRQVTQAEADRMSVGKQGLMAYPDRAAIFVGRDLREKGRVKIWRQDWLIAGSGKVTSHSSTSDGSRVSHIEVRVPAAGLLLVSDSNDMADWWAMCDEIHAVLCLLVGEDGPPMASRLHLGYWHGAESFEVGDKEIANLNLSHPDSFANMCLRAWRDWK